MKNRAARFLVSIACCLFTLGVHAQTLLWIRPFGDSITFGIGFNDDIARTLAATTSPPAIGGATWYFVWPPALAGGGYRGWLTAMTLQNLPTNQSFAFATEGYRNDGSINIQWQSATQFHDGYPGYTNQQLTPFAMRASSADFTLVHSGTNDVLLAKLAPATAFANLQTVVGNLCSANRNTAGKIIVARIIQVTGNFASFQPQVDAYNSNITATTQWPAACGTGRVSVVDMSGGFLNPTSDYSPDGVHPNASGYYKMACAWQNAIQTVRGQPGYQCSPSAADELQALMK